MRLRALGVELPPPVPPVASYAPVVVHGGVAFVSGQLPRNKDGLVRGRVGDDVGVAQAKAAAELCAIAILAVLRHQLGDLDQLGRCLQISGFVSAIEGFEQRSEVVNGASDLMVAALGDAGLHARAAIGVAGLPFGVPVEVSANFALRG